MDHIVQKYNSQINEERQKQARESIAIKKNILLSKFQKENLLKKLEQHTKNIIDSLQKKMNDELIELKKQSNQPKIQNKKALLIGVNYENTSSQLYGCINDVSLINKHLQTRGFSKITVLNEKTDKKPTKSNIISELENFLSTSSPNDFLYLHYSGHGSTLKDEDGDEIDGRDETIVTLDHLNIKDDELSNIIRQKLPKNVTLFATFDSCHSGTMLDLKYNLSDTVPVIENNKYEDSLSNIIMISGCMDKQYSQETLSDSGVGGILTWAFSTMLSKHKSIGLKSLYTNIKNLLNTVGAEQIPQLTSNLLLNIDNIIF